MPVSDLHVYLQILWVQKDCEVRYAYGPFYSMWFLHPLSPFLPVTNHRGDVIPELVGCLDGKLTIAHDQTQEMHIGAEEP